MPADRTPRGTSSTGSIRNRRRDSCTSNSSIPDSGSRPTSPFRPTSPRNGFSPYGTLTPGNSRPGTPFNNQHLTKNFRKTNSSNQTFTSLLAPASPPLSTDGSASNSMDLDPSTVTWECATALVENQKVQSIYEKPVYSTTGQVVSHGKVLTKTVTMTITTTIASTEVLHPGEEGYHASVERYKKQQQEQQQKQQQQQQQQQQRRRQQPQHFKQDVKMESKSFPEAFSPEETTEQERRNFFTMNQNHRLHEQLRKAKFQSPSPTPPMSPVPNPQRQE